MFHAHQLESVGTSAASYIADRASWIHRRVEQITFPRPSDSVYRRDISIDFTIPQLEPVQESESQRYYVPLSLLSRWPPLLRLSLRGSDGAPIPLLTADQNAIVDAALLTRLAESALASRGLSLESPSTEATATLAGCRRSKLHSLPSHEARTGALLRLIPPRVFGALTEEQSALRDDHLFVEIAGAMRDFTLLWLRVEGNPGDREVVKISYDAPFAARIKPLSRKAFGLSPFPVQFEAPHLGGSGSYHLSVSVPSPLRITDAALSIERSHTADGDPDNSEPVAICSSGDGEAECQTSEGVINLYAHTKARDARFYVSGPRTGSEGEARIAVVVERSTLIRPGAAAGFAITILMSALWIQTPVEGSLIEASVTTLLIAPALLAYLIVRPGDHILAGQFVGALRSVLLALGALPLFAALLLVTLGESPQLLGPTFGSLAAISLSLSLFMLFAWRVTCDESRMRPFSFADPRRGKSANRAGT